MAKYLPKIFKGKSIVEVANKAGTSLVLRKRN